MSALSSLTLAAAMSDEEMLDHALRSPSTAASSSDGSAHESDVIAVSSSSPGTLAPVMSESSVLPNASGATSPASTSEDGSNGLRLEWRPIELIEADPYNYVPQDNKRRYIIQDLKKDPITRRQLVALCVWLQLAKQKAIEDAGERRPEPGSLADPATVIDFVSKVCT